MNIHKPEAQGNLCDEQWKAQKHVNVENYSHNMGITDREFNAWQLFRK